MTSPVDPKHTPPPAHKPDQIDKMLPPTPGLGNVDPTGAWKKFLSVGGNEATPKEVKLFMQGMLKMFNVLIQQQQQTAQKANRRLKDIAEKGYSDE